MKIWQDIHYRELDIESLFDVILRNTRSLDMIMIHKSLETKPVFIQQPCKQIDF